MIENIGGQRFQSLTISKAPYADATWTIEAATDLGTWLPARVITDTLAQLTARTRLDGSRSFIRLKVKLLE